MTRMPFALVAALFLASPAGAVNVTVPGDFNTIQAAIDGAPDGAIVQVAPGHYAESLRLEGIGRSLTLRGNPADPAQVVVDAGGAAVSTVMVDDCGGDVVLEGLTITGGTGIDGYGGGLYMRNSDAVFRNCVFRGNAGRMDGGGAFILTSGGFFKDCTFQQNTAVRFGGGMALNLGATTIFDGCAFVENESGTGDPILGWGGGIESNDSSPTLIGCTIARNHSKFAAGGIALTGHYDQPESRVTIRDCEIADNQAIRGRDDLPAPDGGGMHVEDNVVAVLEGCHVHGNTSGNGGGLSSYRATYDISDSLIEGNRAVAVTPDVAGGYGGAITATSVNTAQPVRKASVVTIRRTAIRDNTAHVGGGLLVQGDFGGLSANEATLTLEDSLVAGNSVTGRAGGLFIDRTQAAVRRTQVLSNLVTALHDSWGGGIATLGGATTTVEDSAFCGNGAQEIGGAIYADQGSALAVSGTHFYGNTGGPTSGLGGGAIAVAAASGPRPGPVTGTVRGSILISDGNGPEIWESDCNPAMWSDLLFTSNVIHATGSGVYYRNCTGLAITVPDFNAIAGKAAGNSDATPAFADFHATPATISAGGTTVLSWCTPGATGLAVDQGVGPLGQPFGVVEVTPPDTTLYTFSKGGTPAGAAPVTVACTALGTPVPRSPSNGQRSRPAGGGLTLAWHAASGAETYDVYLDTGAVPVTLVGSDVTTTSLALPPLQLATTYHWKVVAKKTGCATPVVSPVFSFTTCAGTVCFVDDFGDANVSDWAASGRGARVAIHGKMRIRGKKQLMVMSPAPAMGDGIMEAVLDFRAGHQEARFVFGYRRANAFRRLVVTGSGMLRFEERAGGRLRRIAAGRHPLPGGPFKLSLQPTGAAATVSIDGDPALTGQYAGPQSGRFGIQAIATTLMVDDVRVEGMP